MRAAKNGGGMVPPPPRYICRQEFEKERDRGFKVSQVSQVEEQKPDETDAVKCCCLPLLQE
jgi:hypothetical protein